MYWKSKNFIFLLSNKAMQFFLLLRFSLAFPSNKVLAIYFDLTTNVILDTVDFHLIRQTKLPHASASLKLCSSLYCIYWFHWSNLEPNQQFLWDLLVKTHIKWNISGILFVAQWVNVLFWNAHLPSYRVWVSISPLFPIHMPANVCPKLLQVLTEDSPALMPAWERNIWFLDDGQGQPQCCKKAGLQSMKEQ